MIENSQLIIVAPLPSYIYADYRPPLSSDLCAVLSLIHNPLSVTEFCHIASSAIMEARGVAKAIAVATALLALAPTQALPPLPVLPPHLLVGPKLTFEPPSSMMHADLGNTGHHGLAYTTGCEHEVRYCSTDSGYYSLG